MSPAEVPLSVDYSQQASASQFVPQPFLLSSHQAGWENIHLAHYLLPAGKNPVSASDQHTIVLASWQQPTEVEIVFNGKRYLKFHTPDETGHIQILPAHVPLSSRWNQTVEFTHCYLEPDFLTRAAYESVRSDHVEVELVLHEPDPLVWQIISVLKSALETEPNRSKFYAESMATALAAHILQHYTKRKYVLEEPKDGLPEYLLYFRRFQLELI